MVREQIRRLLTGAADDQLVAYRATTLGLVMVAVAAAVLQDAVSTGTGVAALALIPIGFVVSYVRREKRNILLKVVLAAGVLVALAAFLDAVRGATSVDDTRAPLAAIFVWTQVLHSFDVPKARDLSFSVASSVALIAFTGSLAFSTGFVLLVVLYAIWLAAALAAGHHAELRSGAVGELGREVRAAGGRLVAGLARPAAIVIAATLLCAALVLVFLPRVGSAQVVYLPFSFASKTPIPGFVGGVLNPGARAAPGGPTAFDPDAYFGYGQTVDLSARGRLSEELVLRVRSPRPSLYRAQAFDVYRDGVWTSSDQDLDELPGNGTDPIDVPAPPEDRFGRTQQLVQTFYVERELPNVIFHAYRPRELYVPSTSVRVDDFTSLRLPFTLEQDTIYSVVSDVPSASLDELRFAPPVDATAPGAARYLELPSTLGRRFGDLAHRITDRHATAADKAEAVQTWLHRNKRYRLDIPRDPPGKDPIEVFVFDRDEGFCEQIATTMALMLRASGVPTRLVTGFGPGERNLFSGYWEVRNSDAHAWVEVFYPGHGWIPYDPTFGVPNASAANTTFMFEPVRRFFSALVPDVAVRGVAGAFAGVLRTIGGPAFVAALVLLVAAGVWTRRMRRRRRRIRDDRVVEAWMRVEAALAEHGLTRALNETPKRFARRVMSSLEAEAPELHELADEFGLLRYGAAARSPARVERFEERAAGSVKALSRYGSSASAMEAKSGIPIRR